jgi:hypothetical protein
MKRGTSHATSFCEARVQADTSPASSIVAPRSTITTRPSAPEASTWLASPPAATKDSLPFGYRVNVAPAAVAGATRASAVTATSDVSRVAMSRP